MRPSAEIGRAVEPALARPVAHQQEHGAAEPKQDQKPEDVEAPEPEPGIVIARLGEKCRRDRDQENHRPGGSQPEILLLITAERLHLIDVGRLECEHGKRGNAKNCPDIAPFEAFDGNEIANVDDQTGCDDEQEFGYAHDPGHHNRGPGSSQRRSGRSSSHGRRSHRFLLRRNLPVDEGRGGGRLRVHHFARAEIEHHAVLTKIRAGSKRKVLKKGLERVHDPVWRSHVGATRRRDRPRGRLGSLHRR